MKTRVSLLLAFAILSQVSYAQTVKWCIHPEYQSIECFGKNLFKGIERSGKVHVFDCDGKDLLQHVDMDAVGDFDESGYALVLKGKKIQGFITEANGFEYQPVTEECYATKYSFFSEGFFVVADGKGKMGYMNGQGQMVIPCKYEEARPFRQGWASVEVGKKKVYYINTKGKTRNPEGFHGGKLTKGSSFNEKGEAVVANYQDYAVIGTNMQVVRKIPYTSELPVRTCDYAYSKDVEEGCIGMGIYEKDEAKRIPGMEVYSKGDVYGYRWKDGNSEVRLPAQFGYADSFYDGRAIVAKDGKYGVLQLLEGSIVARWPEVLRVYPDGKSNLLHFSIEVPSALDGDKINLEFDEGDGVYRNNTPLTHEFRPVYSRNKNTCTLAAKVSYDGILLLESSTDVKINRITLDIKRPSVATEYADENDYQIVRAIVTNTSSVSVLVEATLKVAGQTTPFKGTLKPKQSQTLTVSVKVTESRQVPASISVKADGHDCGNETSQVSLKI